MPTASGRRVRTKRQSKVAATPAQKAKLEEALEQYAREEIKLAKAQDAMTKIRDEVDTLMKMAKLSKTMSTHSVAEYVKPRSNSKTIIDPVGFHKLVSDEEFYGCVTVGVTAAKKVVAEKTLDSVSKKIAGEKKYPTLKIRPRTKKDEE